MEPMTYVAIAIFITAYALIISEKVHRTVVGLFGAMLMILLGILSETGLFNFLAIWAAKKVKAQPVALLVALSTLTAVCSALLDNVTTVLLTVPVTFNIAAQLKVDVKPFLMAQIISSNIGGTATLIGDPPNIMIGSAVGLSFGDFILNMTAVSVFIFLVTVAIMVFIYRNDLHTKPELQDKVLRLNEKEQITNPALLKKCLAVLAFTITLFAFHGMLGLESATAALTGAGLLLLVSFHNNEEMIAKMLSKIEWLAIFFFGGLFILVGALVETGVIKMLAEKAMEITHGDLTFTAIVIIWMSAIASAFIDNIPFVATMIPLIKDMGTMGLTNLDPLWWSLALGACLGGNGTLIGASANVVVASMAAQRGRAISFIGFMKVAFPLMILSIIISTAYVYFRYL